MCKRFVTIFVTFEDPRRHYILNKPGFTIRLPSPHPITFLPVPCCRSALDDLAGRGGRGAEDDPMRLSARGLLQFLRARIREKSLAAAPADLLPASAVCQVHFIGDLTCVADTGGHCFAGSIF